LASEIYNNKKQRVSEIRPLCVYVSGFKTNFKPTYIWARPQTDSQAWQILDFFLNLLILKFARLFNSSVLNFQQELIGQIFQIAICVCLIAWQETFLQTVQSYTHFSLVWKCVIVRVFMGRCFFVTRLHKVIEVEKCFFEINLTTFFFIWPDKAVYLLLTCCLFTARKSIVRTVSTFSALAMGEGGGVSVIVNIMGVSLVESAV